MERHQSGKVAGFVAINLSRSKRYSHSWVTLTFPLFCTVVIKGPHTSCETGRRIYNQRFRQLRIDEKSDAISINTVSTSMVGSFLM